MLPEQEGLLEADGIERTISYKQDVIKDHLPADNADNIFDLSLDHGPYYISYTRNGRYMLIGGRKGHVASFSCSSSENKSLQTEFSVKERIRDVQFLQNEKLFAVAQKKYTYIYDDQGLEVH